MITSIQQYTVLKLLLIPSSCAHTYFLCRKFIITRDSIDNPTMSSSPSPPVLEDSKGGAPTVDSRSSVRGFGQVVHLVGDGAQLSLMQACRSFCPALCWCLLFSLGVIMAGFDPQLIGTLVAIPSFQKDFGADIGDGTYVVPAQWQSAFNLGAPVGSVLGAFGVGIPLDRWGRKWTLAGCSIVSCISVAIQFSARSRAQLLVAELINGVAIGAYPVISPTYISETTPVVLRGPGAAFINLSYVIGQLVASGILAGTQARHDRLSYDIPFATQWIWPVLILVALPFCPESPYWLVQQGRDKDALASLKRLTTEDIDCSAILANIQQTTAIETSMSESVGFISLFQGPDLRRTIITTMVYVAQSLVGNYFVIGYAVYFFELAGLPTRAAFDLGVGLIAVGFVATCLSWPLIAAVGRRPIYFWGLFSLTVVLLLIGILDVVPNYNSPGNKIAWAQSSLMVIYNLFYGLTIGPLGYVIMCEASSTKLRSKTIAFSTTVNMAVSVALAVAIPYAINPDQGNMRGKLSFVFFGTAIPCLVWCWLCLPEMKGRSFAQIDLMFTNHVKTRDFRRYETDLL